jgi:hypothetical protein
VADFQTVAAGVFEKDGVVSFIFPPRTFDVSRTSAGGDPSQAIDFRGAFRPERDSALVRHVTGRFGDAEKCSRSVIWCRASYWNQFGIAVARAKPSAGSITS